jgi:hypothetical protein
VPLVWQCSECPETTAFDAENGIEAMNEEFRKHCALEHRGTRFTPYDADQNDWCPFDREDPSTLPEDNREVEFEYASGKRYNVAYFHGYFSASGRLNSAGMPVPEETYPLRWRYVERDTAK